MVRGPRADKQAQAAVHNFEEAVTAAEAAVDRSAYVRLNWWNSSLWRHRRDRPKTLLFFLLNVLQKMVNAWWKTAVVQVPYLKKQTCNKLDIPPAVIAVFGVVINPTISASLSEANVPATNKTQVYASEVARSGQASSSGSVVVEDSSEQIEKELAEQWAKFDASVCQYIIVPLCEAGIIDKAPLSSEDPVWWRAHVMPILDAEGVYNAIWKGGKKRAKRSWDAVVQFLETHRFRKGSAFLPPLFEAMTAQAFLEKAGYAKPEGDDESGSQKRKAELVEPSVAPEMTDVPKMTVVPGKKTELLHKVAGRFAYSELCQAARERLATDIAAPDSASRDAVASAYEEFRETGTLRPRDLSLLAVVAEVRVSLSVLQWEKAFPSWLVHPHDKMLRNIEDAEDAYTDPGNEMWEAMFSMINMASIILSTDHKDRINTSPTAPYGDRVNKSSKGNYNFRGNMLERLLTWLYEGQQLEHGVQPWKKT